MQTEFRSLYEITGKITDHNMLVVPAAKLKALTLYEKLAEEYGLSIFPDLEALAAEIALLRTGYAAARLEIESLKAQLTERVPAVDESYKQALRSKNCMQCCVSYMLGLPLESVPNFATAGGWDRFASFAESQGYAAVMLPGNHEFEADYLASGTTERGTPHMVVMNDGKLVHDPHPSNAGLVEVQCVWLLTKKATPQGHHDEHAAFEASAKAYTSNVSFERDEHDYADMTASLLWHGWKLRAARAPADSVPVARFDDPKVQAVYAILCSDVQPPEGEHWEGFAARRTVDALSADSVLEDAARYEYLRDCTMGERNRLEHYSGPALDVVIDAARKQGGAT